MECCVALLVRGHSASNPLDDSRYYKEPTNEKSWTNPRCNVRNCRFS